MTLVAGFALGGDFVRDKEREGGGGGLNEEQEVVEI